MGIKVPALMGILNVTPDSFSDGGLFLSPDMAIDAGYRMRDEGADIIDVGGESTRPGSAPVSLDSELGRVLPVVKALVNRNIRVSIDTSKSEVARQATLAGAEIVNDVTAMQDPDMAGVCASAGCTVCLMHMKGEPRTMQVNPTYGDVVVEVRDYLLHRVKYAEQAGIARDRIWIDPGIGFGKTLTHNLELLKHLSDLVATGLPVLVGVSRKSFIGKVLDLTVDQRLEGTLAAQTLAQTFGACVIRAHDVKESRRAIDLTAAVLSS